MGPSNHFWAPKSPDRLDGIDHEQDVTASERRSQGTEVRSKAAPELDRADRQHPGAPIAESHHAPDVDPALLRLVEPELDAFSLQPHPRVDVGGKLTMDADDVVPGLPIETGRDQAKPRGRVLGKGDRLRTYR